MFRLLGGEKTRWRSRAVLFSSFVPSPPPPTLLCFLSRSNPPLDMLPLCSATLTSRLVPLLPGRPRRAPDNGMNVATLKPPRGCWEKTQECVGWGDNALFSRGSVGGAGIMGLGADLQPLPAGGAVYTGGGGPPEGCSHICLEQRSSLVFSIMPQHLSGRLI